MTPIPEPAADIRAQIAAMLDSHHPKLAVLVVPGNEPVIPTLPSEVFRIERPEGTLLTMDRDRAAAFSEAADDVTMAWILGYPEDKAAVVRACGGIPLSAKSVQARDPQGNVITEAFTSPAGLSRTRRAMSAHVPVGGSLVVLTAMDAIARRLSLRMEEARHG